MSARNAGASARAYAAQLRADSRRGALRRSALLAAGAASIGGIIGAPAGPATTLLGAAALGGLGFWKSWRWHRSDTNTVAIRWEQGAAGEQLTAQLIDPLRAQGWWVVHDRALPRSRANVDHLLIHLSGTGAIVVDTKNWRARGATVHAAGGTLMYGTWDQRQTLETVLFEAEQVHRALGVPTVPVIAVHGAPVADGGHLQVHGVHIVSAARLTAVLRAIPGRPDPKTTHRLAQRAEAALPPYEQ